MTDERSPSEAIFSPSSREILDRGAIGMCVLSVDGYHLHVNQVFRDMVDRTLDELKGLRWTDLLDAASLEHVGDWRSALERDGRWRAELQMMKADGSLVPVLSVISLVRNDKGQVSYLFKQTMDLTHFRDLEKSLRGATAVTNSVLAALELLGEGVMIIDPSTILPNYVNAAITKISGYSAEELRSMPGGLMSRLPAAQAAEFRDRMERRLRGEDVPSYYELEVLHKDGTPMTVECAVQLIPGEPDLLFSIVRDITERKVIEDHLQRADRIDAMGRLAAGTAHDFNNLLTSVLGEADLLLQSLEQDPANTDWGEIRQGVVDLRETAELGTRIAKQLVKIGAPRGLTSPSVDVREVIEKMEDMLSRAIAPGVRLETALCDDETLARIFPDELEQVLLNLVLNASDALVEGGTIRILTARVPLRAEKRAHPLRGTDDLIVLTVTDDGPGISPEVQERMFEPFFTTKGSRRGTGLGLSVVDAVVTRAHGTVTVDTQPGRGTTMTVRLPAVS